MSINSSLHSNVYLFMLLIYHNEYIFFYLYRCSYEAIKTINIKTKKGKSLIHHISLIKKILPSHPFPSPPPKKKQKQRKKKNAN